MVMRSSPKDRDVNFRAEAGERLIDRVVDDLGDQVMKSAFVRVTDVHPGALADCLQTFKNLDGVGAVTVGNLFVCHRKKAEQPLPNLPRNA